MARKSKSQISISNSEWSVMQVLWNESPLYMGDIIKKLSGTKWKRTTIQTMTTRLVAKGALGTNRSGYAFLYFPLVSEDSFSYSETTDFVNRVHYGSISKCVEMYLEQNKISAEEKEALKKLVKGL